MRKAAKEAKVYGVLTYSKLNTAHKKYIADRVNKNFNNVNGTNV